MGEGTASIGDSSGNMVFEQKDINVPTTWSMTATNVVVSKYFKDTSARKSARPASSSSRSRR